MKILAVCMGSAETLTGKSYKTGILKIPVSGPVQVDGEGLLGDRICNRKHHGGPDQAVYIEGGATLDWWAVELGQPLAPGMFGENLVMSDLDNRDVAVGDRFVIGPLILEATAPRTPCATFASRMNDSMFVKRYTASGRPGIYCRVLAPGFVEAGQAVRHELYAGDRVTMPELLAAYGRKLEKTDIARFLAAPLAIRIRTFFTEKL
ncbi:MOSC domain-containing protein [Agrobacterium sp. a22-2]|uniref:MOSC domain-containing protein n=1 Tax=Agrobacterium sp. a22-2 TaxID=2283840 RepID=UPI001447010C|nr:MOSC domain-containing protein [Agrobacterium sp. a22-2]NKN37205.1 MOSC domain-containing protein [Agrobacterium sp. a22-2]